MTTFAESTKRTDRIDEFETDCSPFSLGELCDYLVNTRHADLKKALPRIGSLLLHVAEGDAERHPELHRVLELFSRLAGDLNLHMTKEEEILFPLIEEIEGHSATHDLSLLIERLEEEHERVGETFGEMRLLTRDFTPPAGSCSTYRTVLAALGHMERDLQALFDIEENILFFRACQIGEWPAVSRR